MDELKGILWQRDIYTSRLVTIFRYAGFIGCLLVVLYGALVWAHFLPSERFYEPAFLVLAPLFIISGFILLFITKPRPLFAFVRLFILQILAAAFLLFVTGFQSPIVICWLILFTAAYFYFNRPAFYLSVCFLLITAIIDVALMGSPSLAYIVTNSAIVAALVFVGWISAWIGFVQAAVHDGFNQTRLNEMIQKDRMLSVINSMGDAIINTDENGTIVTYNAATLNLFDTNDSLTGRKIDEIIPLKNQEGKKVLLFKEACEQESLTIREDLSYHFSDGESMRLGINCTPVHTSYASGRAQNGYIFIMRDITKTKSLEEERDEFISVVSHELRTPITIAEGTVSNAQVLLERDASKDKLKSALDEAHQQTLYLAKMINDLSTLSRAERGAYGEPEEIDLEQMLHALYHEYQSQAAAKQLHLNLDIKGKLGTLTTSRLYLEETLQNFITNAIKYTQEGSVTIIGERNDDNTITLSVKDTGIGISKSDKRNIFKKFYRSEDYRIRQTSGTGLGLYVVHKLAQRMGATIEVKSRLNHGSTFSITLGNIPTPEEGRQHG